MNKYNDDNVSNNDDGNDGNNDDNVRFLMTKTIIIVIME